MLRKLMQLIAIMIILSAIGAFIISLAGRKDDAEVLKSDNKINIVTTIYPVYLIGLNIADQIENVEVNSLIDRNTGCIHDYQLTTEDMKLIATADVLVINGGGMEGFLEDITSNYPELTVIDASQGISMLSNGEVQLEDALEEGEYEYGEYNPHVWLNPKLYIEQIENVRDGLIQYLNTTSIYTNKETEKFIMNIEENSQTYITKVQELDDDIETYKESLAQSSNEIEMDNQVVIFHDSFAYLAERIGMKVAFTVPLEADTALSAGAIADIVDDVRKNEIKYLFTEQQYSDSIAKQIEEETDAKVYIIDSVVTGDGAKDSYLKAMQNNLNVLKAAAQ